MQFIIKDQDKGRRLDQCLSASTPNLSRSQIKRLIESGNITVNDQSSEPSYKLKKGDEILIKIPPPEKSKIIPEEIPLDVLYEDKDILVINKPRGLTVHPGAGRKSGTLVNALLHHCKDLSGIGGVERPGIVHRLDKDTSGVLLIAKNDHAHKSLSQQFKDRTIEKTYLAVVLGNLKNDSGIISAPIGRHPVDRKKMTALTLNPSPSPSTSLRTRGRGKIKSREAVTYYKVLKRLNGYTLVELKPKTGRTHQLRVHMKFIGHPIEGDPIYGIAKGANAHSRLLLHAYKIKFTHPRSGEVMEFKAEIPEDMLYYLNDTSHN